MQSVRGKICQDALRNSPPAARGALRSVSGFIRRARDFAQLLLVLFELSIQCINLGFQLLRCFRILALRERRIGIFRLELSELRLLLRDLRVQLFERRCCLLLCLRLVFDRVVCLGQLRLKVLFLGLGFAELSLQSVCLRAVLAIGRFGSVQLRGQCFLLRTVLFELLLQQRLFLLEIIRTVPCVPELRFIELHTGTERRQGRVCLFDLGSKLLCFSCEFYLCFVSACHLLDPSAN